VVQVFCEIAKALALVPDRVTLVTVKLPLPVLDTVNDIGAEVVVDGVFGKASAEVESVAVGCPIEMADELDEQPASKERNTVVTASPEMR
jgi:hypothetical protein